MPCEFESVHMNFDHQDNTTSLIGCGHATRSETRHGDKKGHTTQTWLKNSLNVFLIGVAQGTPMLPQDNMTNPVVVGSATGFKPSMPFPGLMTC
jgi:hypothetical protein